jgi:YjjG family noncanonical pyrimidine nucleotidase
MKSYKCILFDLDHTLWDYETNSEITLTALFSQFALQKRGITSFKFFFETFNRVNTGLWDLHDKGLIGQDVIRLQRFHKVFTEAGLEDYALSLEFSSEYLRELPKQNNLLPFAKETLEYLASKYPMVIVTNGFDEIQGTKLNSGGIRHHFSTIVTSQRAGKKKPSREIFDFALGEVGHVCADSIMIGDNLNTDIAGARSAGIDTVYFNPIGKLHKEQVTHEIKALSELRDIL